MAETPQISPLQRVVAAAAGKEADRVTTLFALDNACAHVARVVREPAMAQIRLAWWRDGIAAEYLPPALRSIQMESLRSISAFSAIRYHLVAIIDGWEALILDDGHDSQSMLSDYAQGRGAGLFSALYPQRAGDTDIVGRVWALWDLAGHVGDDGLARQAIVTAQKLVLDGSRCPRALPRMLRMLGNVAWRDVVKGRGAPPNLTPGLYARLLRVQIFGR